MSKIKVTQADREVVANLWLTTTQKSEAARLVAAYRIAACAEKDAEIERLKQQGKLLVAGCRSFGITGPVLDSFEAALKDQNNG